ncbi:Nucleoporin Nup43 [Gracilariopsis chorda]|uniref:Nucleoporin Nup43 n=1 Tax=Gracilariopsis chorda TaxID=448386 RepID=A0A2V3J0K0_9FLOR|nr:Nucleoporin Nup43 [Gracilariopsis chorda]|eukprot:PXF47855.1 Nucleoporin Nup43 [Gracilariopsis chorda]
MHGMRRTIPRSARRAPVKSEPAPASSKTFSTTEPNRYVPDFNAKANETASEMPLVAKHPQPQMITPPLITVTSAAQNCIRWLPNVSEDAVGVIGSGDGENDFLTFYSVTAKEELDYKSIVEVAHEGKVNKISVTDEGQVYTASSTGSVYTISGLDPHKKTLHKICDIEKFGKPESVSSVASSAIGLVAAGVHGSLMIIDNNTGQVSSLQFDEVGFRDLISVDERGTEIVTAGCDIAVWDVRSGDRTDLIHPGKCVATCVGIDPGQPHFVMGGMRNGELAIWDRRSDSLPFNRIGLHSGPIWDLGVVSSSRAGMLLSCGEDGNVNLVDFTKAGDRGGFGSIEQAFCDQGEFWRAGLSLADITSVTREALAVNSVNSHRSAALFAYATDGGVLGFGNLSS